MMNNVLDKNAIKSFLQHVIQTNRLLFVLLCLCFVQSATANSNPNDVGATLLHHITDQPTWQPVPFLPPIPLDGIKIGEVIIPFSKFVVMLLINALLLVIVFAGTLRNAGIIPTRAASFVEPLVFFVRDFIVYPAMGEEMGKKWLSFFTTLFFFILGANVIGMIPLFSTATGSLSVTSALAVVIFLITLIAGFKKNGFVGFFANMIPEGLPKVLGAVILCIEIPVLIIRNAVLAIRLFANMIAGHLIISSLLLLIFLIHPLASLVSVPGALFIDLLELLIVLIQAMVFTMLSAIFINLAVAHH